MGAVEVLDEVDSLAPRGAVGRLWVRGSRPHFEHLPGLKPEAQLMRTSVIRKGVRTVFGLPGGHWFVGQTLEFEAERLKDWPSDQEIEALCAERRSWSVLDQLLDPDWIVESFGARLTDFCERAIVAGRLRVDDAVPIFQKLEKVLALAARAGTPGERRTALVHTRRFVNQLMGRLS